MSNAQLNVDGIEKLLDRVSTTTEQITKASERQAREVDRRLKKLLDRGEASTERWLATIDKRLRAQIAGLSRELRTLERHADELRTSTAKRPATKRATASKGRAKAAAPRKATTRKAPSKKTAAKKTAARTTTTKKRARRR